MQQPKHVDRLHCRFCSDTVAIGNPEWHVHKTSHRGSKQQ